MHHKGAVKYQAVSQGLPQLGRLVWLRWQKIGADGSAHSGLVQPTKQQRVLFETHTVLPHIPKGSLSAAILTAHMGSALAGSR
jgi:hypothetical protein